MRTSRVISQRLPPCKPNQPRTSSVAADRFPLSQPPPLTLVGGMMTAPSQNPTLSLRGQLQLTVPMLRREYPHWNIDFLDELDSTSTEARRRIADGRAGTSPFLVAALHQSAGRGQQTRRWSAPAGSSLLFTAAIPLSLAGRRLSGIGIPSPDYPPTLWPLQVGVAVALRLRLLGWETELKWPNDILVSGHKIGGLLCESVGGWLLVGLGMNLTQKEEDFLDVEPGKTPPGSLATSTRKHPFPMHPVQVAPSIIQSVMTVMESPWPRRRMLNYYREWCVTLGRSVAYGVPGGNIVQGIASAVLEDGRLTVDTGDGNEVPVTSGFQEYIFE
jgi:BirA family biotin operon repressor/biotin-[acetyl-CoA-carboxylase] ligase